MHKILTIYKDRDIVLIEIKYVDGKSSGCNCVKRIGLGESR
jgi:hypothetical protein